MIFSVCYFIICFASFPGVCHIPLANSARKCACRTKGIPVESILLSFFLLSICKLICSYFCLLHPCSFACSQRHKLYFPLSFLVSNTDYMSVLTGIPCPAVARRNQSLSHLIGTSQFAVPSY